jgi:hypothetical protein
MTIPGVLVSSHGPDAEKDHHEDDEHDYYQADHEEKHSTTQTGHGRMVGAGEAHAAMARAFPCIASTLDTSKAGHPRRDSGAPGWALS